MTEYKLMTRADLVLVNRVQMDYLKDELPNANQIRYDVTRLVALCTRLNDQLAKSIRNQSG